MVPLEHNPKQNKSGAIFCCPPPKTKQERSKKKKTRTPSPPPPWPPADCLIRGAGSTTTTRSAAVRFSPTPPTAVVSSMHLGRFGDFGDFGEGVGSLVSITCFLSGSSRRKKEKCLAATLKDSKMVLSRSLKSMNSGSEMKTSGFGFLWLNKRACHTLYGWLKGKPKGNQSPRQAQLPMGPNCHWATCRHLFYCCTPSVPDTNSERVKSGDPNTKPRKSPYPFRGLRLKALGLAVELRHLPEHRSKFKTMLQTRNVYVVFLGWTPKRSCPFGFPLKPYKRGTLQERHTQMQNRMPSI